MIRPSHAEPEVLATLAHKAAAAAIASPNHLTPEQTTDAMLPAAIEAATGYAERCFLALVADARRMPRHIRAGRVDRIALDVIGDMMADAVRIADELQATDEQRRRLVMGRAVLFDLRLAELQARTALEGGTA